jgi:hypothetical protein
MIQELAEIEEDTVSVGSLVDLEDGTEARAEFIGNKISATAKSLMAETGHVSDTPKQVEFKEGHVVIPHKEAEI